MNLGEFDSKCLEQIFLKSTELDSDELSKIENC